DEEAVPVVAQVYLVQDLPAERLHRVRVRYRDVEDRATQTVVDAGDRRLLVAAYLPAGDDVPPLVQPGEKARDLLRRMLEVGVEQDEPGSGGVLGTGDERLRLAEVSPVSHDAQPVPAGGLPQHGVRRAIARAIIHP